MWRFVITDVVSVLRLCFVGCIFLSNQRICTVNAWGSDDDSTTETAIYGDALNRDWLYSATGISLQLEGCVWGYVYSNEDADCMENSSQDGTTYWYQMANCRRAQAVYRMYSTENGYSASCNNQNFKESFITTNGLSTFINYVSQSDGSSNFDDVNGNVDDGAYDDDGGNKNEFDEYPNCEQTNNGYVGLGCTDDGKFALQYFSDSYCLTPTGKTYNKLNSLNRYLNTFKQCMSVSSGQIKANGESLPEVLIATSASCSSLDSGYCADSSAMQQRRGSTTSLSIRSYAHIGEKSWVTKLKYATGGLLLLASFVMFTGILFTNRRRRRALMQRKYRQSRSDRSRKSRSSKSRSRKSSRSKSRAREKEAEGYFT